MEINIRRADTNDAGLLSSLSSITFLDTFRGTCTEKDIQGFVKEHFNTDKISKELKDEADYYFIGFINNQPAGYLRLKEEISDVSLIKKYEAIELKRIYVLKEFHDKKIGAALLEFTLKFAKENHYEAVWLGVWEHNEKAKTFYKKFGFIDTGVEHDFPIGNTPQTDHWFIKVL